MSSSKMSWCTLPVSGSTSACAPRLGCPVVAIVHHLRCREQHPAFMTRLYRRVEKRYLASVDGCICVSRTTEKDVEALVGRAPPLVVATPGRDGLPGAVTREAIIARATAPGPFNLIFVGNLIPRKELHTLLTALAQLTRDDWHLTVAGSLEMDAAYVEAIRRQIKDAGLASRVSLLGRPARPELAARCAASHLMAVPSSYEGFGIVYLEGMHFGLPAIAGTAGAAKESLPTAITAFWCRRGMPPPWPITSSLLMEDRELLQRMSLTAHHSRRGPSHLERQRRPGAGLPPEFPEVTVSGPAAPTLSAISPLKRAWMTAP